jgi:hypothetical protein
MDLKGRLARYAKRWQTIYMQWEFWALAIGAIGGFRLLDELHMLPEFLAGNASLRGVIIAAIIMLPMPLILERKRRRKNDDWFARLLKRVAASGRVAPYVISGCLGLSVVAFLCPVFGAPGTTAPLSGWELLLRHPVAAAVPLLYIVCSVIVLWSYKEWRLTALLWIIGGYAGTWAVALAYTNTDANVAPGYEWALATLLLAPLVALAVCLIRPRI